MLISIIGAIINILLNIVLIKYYGLTGAAMSLLISYLLIFILKYFYDNKNMINTHTHDINGLTETG